MEPIEGTINANGILDTSCQVDQWVNEILRESYPELMQDSVELPPTPWFTPIEISPAQSALGDDGFMFEEITIVETNFHGQPTRDDPYIHQHSACGQSSHAHKQLIYAQANIYEQPNYEESYTNEQTINQQTFMREQPINRGLFMNEQPLNQQLFTNEQLYMYEQPMYEESYTNRQPSYGELLNMFEGRFYDTLSMEATPIELNEENMDFTQNSDDFNMGYYDNVLSNSMEWSDVFNSGFHDSQPMTVYDTFEPMQMIDNYEPMMTFNNAQTEYQNEPNYAPNTPAIRQNNIVVNNHNSGITINISHETDKDDLMPISVQVMSNQELQNQVMNITIEARISDLTERQMTAQNERQNVQLAFRIEDNGIVTDPATSTTRNLIINI